MAIAGGCCCAEVGEVSFEISEALSWRRFRGDAGGVMGRLETVWLRGGCVRCEAWLAVLASAGSTERCEPLPVPGNDPEDPAASALWIGTDFGPKVIVEGSGADVGSERSLGVAGMVGMCPFL